jgi:O-acetyl-ADP-ribose deacetylase (regulator of RNase III)
MIEITRGNLLEADVEAIVNTVNTVGVMGKGIALQFKKAFPENFTIYKKACDAKELHPGKMLVVATNAIIGTPRYIINFPTKRHWRGKSKMEDIDSGLAALTEEVRSRAIKSIAVPPLGCGNGGLRWSEVLPRITNAFADLPDVRVLVFEPAGAPAPRKMLDRTKRPEMTPGRAAVLCLMNRYLVPGYPYLLSMLEIQKLAYFMQVSGQELKLNFQKHLYGPYADNLRKVLEKIDGHFIEGYGDGDGTNAPSTSITLLADAAIEAESFLSHDLESQKRFAHVADLIEGYETAYGMELLSSVHWIATQECEAAKDDVETAVREIQNWNPRKRETLEPVHIRTAWQRLREKGWFN